ncbi:DUF4077 domain-containing protein [Bacillus sp. BGMRC 2118]|nr:DUF4077 domain-containing protein [Bacillus sp. BGMRC 2118]
MQWLKNKCFSNLELESQKNNLFMFIIISAFFLGMGALGYYGYLFSSRAIPFWSVSVVIFVLGISLSYVEKAVPIYKYMMAILLLAMTYIMIHTFPETPAVYHLIYFTFAASLIYLNERLILMLGVVSLVVTMILFNTFHEQFFAYTTPGEGINFAIFLITIVVAMWGVTRIGKTLLSRLDQEKKEVLEKAKTLEETQKLLEASVEQLRQKLTVLTGNVHTSNESMSEINTAFQEVATSAQSQSEMMNNSVDLLTGLEANMVELISQVKEASSSIHASLTVSKTSEETLGGFDQNMTSLNEVMQESGQVIRELTEQTKKVNDIVDVITGISKQTSLLALNANIEAARAGEHGKGFAVVANEVWKLADESNRSAGMIQDILTDFSHRASVVEEQIKKGEQVQQESNEMLLHLRENMQSLGDFILSIDQLMAEIVQHQETSKSQSSTVVSDVTNVTSLIQETSASTEQVLASVEQEVKRNETSLEALQTVARRVSELEKILRK